MKIGAHVSTAGGVDKAVDRASELGAEAIQIFCSSPQGWAFKPLTQSITTTFTTKSRESGISPVFLHGIYLINLGSPNPELVHRSIETLVNYMNAAAELSATGVIFHAGSHKGTGYEGIVQQAVDALQEVIGRSPEGPRLIIENSAGMGHHIGSHFREIGRIIEAVGSPRVKVCLDTQHAFAAGYNVANKEKLAETMEEFDREIGLGNLSVVHANDSKRPLGDGVDRHENIGAGYIGEAGFETIMAHPAFRDVPFILEVPGEGGNGPDKPNLERLKDIRSRCTTSY